MNTPKIITLGLALMLTVFMSSCDVEDICTSGQGSVVDSTFVLPNFTGIDLQMAGNVYLKQGPVQSVRIVGQPNILEKLNMSVGNQIWAIDVDGCIRNYEALEVYVTIPEIDYLRVSGSGDIVSDSVLIVDDVEILLTGSGNIDVAMDADFVYSRLTGSGTISLDALINSKLETKTTGSGSYVLAGRVPKYDVEIVGSGDIKAFDMVTSEAEVKISGSGDAEVLVEDSLTIDISGSGDVAYKGNPSLDIEITGSGRVVDAN